jgi:hypothetical protein
MAWSTEETEEFTQWLTSLTRKEQLKVLAAVELLMEDGPLLGRPVVDTLKGSKYPNLKELRMTGTTLRAFFAFDLLRTAILLCGGDKGGANEHRFYERMIDLAERLYERHLEALALRESE